MEPIQPGDKARAICAADGLVPVTYARRDVPFSDGGGIAPGTLAGVCDVCGEVVSVPAQSTPAIAAARARADALLAVGNLADLAGRFKKAAWATYEVYHRADEIRTQLEFHQILHTAVSVQAVKYTPQSVGAFKPRDALGAWAVAELRRRSWFQVAATADLGVFADRDAAPDDIVLWRRDGAPAAASLTTNRGCWRGPSIELQDALRRCAGHLDGTPFMISEAFGVGFSGHQQLRVARLAAAAGLDETMFGRVFAGPREHGKRLLIRQDGVAALLHVARMGDREWVDLIDLVSL